MRDEEENVNTKTQFVMFIVRFDPDVVRFGTPRQAWRYHGLSRGISMELEVWRAMGKPSIITVTLEPGDTLNEDPGLWGE